MKKVWMIMSGFIVALALASCDNEDELPGLSKSEQAVEQIVEALRSKPEVSEFVKLLEKADVSDLDEETLTVFAVQNTSAKAQAFTRAGGVETLDSVSVKRHIVAGAYAKGDLTDGKVLKNLSGEELYVTYDANGNVCVNNVPVTGSAIPAGASYVYMVPEVFDEQSAPLEKQTAVISVYGLSSAGPAPLADVQVNAVVGDSTLLGVFTTDGNGQVRIEHAGDLSWSLSKEGYSDIYDGYLLAGMTEDGNFAYADLNGDGRIDEADKTDITPWVYSTASMEPTAGGVYTCYMAEEDSEGGTVDVAGISREWKQQMQLYLSENRMLDAQLTPPGYGGMGFTDSEMRTLSDNYWRLAYQALESGQYFQKKLEGVDDVAAKTLGDSISVEMALIVSQLSACYTQVVWGGGLLPADKALLYMNELQAVLPSTLSAPVCLATAKLALCTGGQEWLELALNNAEKLLENDSYKLLPSTEDVFASASNSEVIWGGYKDQGVLGMNYLHPFLLREAYLIKATALVLLGNPESATDCINRLAIALGQEAVTPDKMYREYLMELSAMALKGTGELYPFYRVLGMDIPLGGFVSPKNWLLPIPDFAMNEYTFLQQNKDY